MPLLPSAVVAVNQRHLTTLSGSVRLYEVVCGPGIGPVSGLIRPKRPTL
jgi:hypothetical protein